MREPVFVATDDVVRGGLWRLFPCVNVDKTKDIPRDWPGPMGVPISYMAKHNPARFEILGSISPKIGGRNLYKRIVIRNLRPELPEVIDLAERLERAGMKLEIIEGGRL